MRPALPSRPFRALAAARRNPGRGYYGGRLLGASIRSNEIGDRPMRNVVIAGYARSPFHFAHKGELRKVRPDEMAAQVIEALIKQTGVPAEDIEDVIVGCAFPEGEQGFNVARLIGLLGHLPLSAAGATVNRFC